MKLKIAVNLKVSKFIRQFIVADMLLFAGWGMVDPVFSVFIVREVLGASLVTVGVAVAIYWILKSAIQVPIALFLDQNNGERDDFYVLIGALVLAGFSSFALIAATRVWHVYLIQVLKAVAFGMYVPAWSALFSRHLDKGHYSLDWSLDSTSVGLVIGVTGFLSGIIVTWFGYSTVFILAGFFSLISAAVLFTLPYLVLPPKTGMKPILKDHGPVNINQ